MIQFAPTSKPQPGKRWVDHAAELPTSPIRKVFDGHLRVQRSVLEKHCDKARAAGKNVSYQIAGGAVGLIATAQNDMAKRPTNDREEDRKAAYTGLCALAAGRLISRFFDKEVEHLLNLVELEVLSIRAEALVLYEEGEQAPAKCSLHVSRELLAPQVKSPLPQIASEGWYAVNGLYIQYQSPADPFEAAQGDITREEAIRVYAGNCTITPFLAAP